MLNKVLNIVVAALCAVALGISLLVGGCDVSVFTLTGSVPMKCVWGFMCVSLLLGVGLVLALVRFFLKTTEARRFAALSLALIALAAACIPSPLAVGVCSWDGMALCCSYMAEAGATAEELAWCGLTMDCHISAIAVWIMAVLVLIASIIQTAIAASGTGKEKKPKLFD